MKQLDGKKYKNRNDQIQSIEEDSREDLLSSHFNYGKEKTIKLSDEEQSEIVVVDQRRSEIAGIPKIMDGPSSREARKLTEELK